MPGRTTDPPAAPVGHPRQAPTGEHATRKPGSRPGTFYALGSGSAFLAVALGAFGAHGLRSSLSPEMLSVFETGVRYQMYHALAMIATAWAYRQWGSGRPAAFKAAGWCFAAGTLLFSGSLYVLSSTGLSWVGAITPFGGLCFLAGWCVLGLAVWKRRGD